MKPARASAPSAGLTPAQKKMFVLAALLVGPALLKRWFEAPKSDIDLSAWNIVTSYDKPAIEKLDSTVRIEFCAS